ncbi:hypothetical protein PIB30_068270 [Stylosanthes scabra]|uniref:Uncharacterized protein n=1 Tax=Stylosanthes scabra TaxID=79078 RepID=A0ABU6YM95_9FABA|nr:hypothetical protein [Stylosanthes scabra]
MAPNHDRSSFVCELRLRFLCPWDEFLREGFFDGSSSEAKHLRGEWWHWRRRDGGGGQRVAVVLRLWLVVVRLWMITCIPFG